MKQARQLANLGFGLGVFVLVAGMFLDNGAVTISGSILFAGGTVALAILQGK